MTVSISLTDGASVVVYQTPTGVGFDELDSALAPESLGVTVNSGPTQWIDAQSLSDGGFLVAWSATGGGPILVQDFGASGTAVDQPHAYGASLPLAPLAFASNGSGPTAVLPNGETIVSSEGPAPNLLNDLQIQPYAPNGAAMAGPYVQTASPISGYLPLTISALTGGGFVAAFAHNANYTSRLELETFTAQGTPITDGVAATYSGLVALSPGAYSVAGLADGGFVAAWTINADGNLNGATPSDQVYVQEYSVAGTAVGASEDLGAAAAIAAPTIDALADGHYVVSWSAGAGLQHRVFDEQGVALGAVDPAAPDYGVDPVGPATALTAAAGWSDAVVLSDHQLVVVGTADGGYGSLVAVEHTYDAMGNLVGSATLMGYAGAGQSLVPEVEALAGGFYEVGYVGSSNYEIYSASGQLAFAHNTYTSPTAAFTPLSNGDYVTTDSGQSVFGLFDATGAAIAWQALPSDAPGAAEVSALQGGGFVFTYAGSSHYDQFDATGHLLAQGDLGAAASSFATALVATADGGFAKAWLSMDGGQYGLPTALDFQVIGANGQATATVLTLGQDLDPWHTQIAIQAHADGSDAILWSQGGAIWGAEYADGVVGPTEATGLTGALSSMEAIQLPKDAVGLAFLQNGQAWAEIFDPATGGVDRVDLGSATGDLSSLHALATADGGMAISWHDGAEVLASILSPAGIASPVETLPGDLIGVDSSGHALGLSTTGQDVPVLQAYGLGGGSFWVS